MTQGRRGGVEPKGLKNLYFYIQYQFFDLNHSVVNFFCDISCKLQLDMGVNQRNGVFS